MKRLSVFALGLSLLVAGCTAQFGYRFADTLIEWRLDDYVELDDKQQQQVSSVIDELHLWHAQEELPKYRRSLTKLRELIVTQQFEQHHIAQFEQQLWDYWGNVQQRLASEADLLSQLTVGQRRQLLDNLNEQLAERRQEQRDDEKNAIVEQLERESRREERLEQWTGSITEEQQNIIRQWVQDRPEGSHWLAYRQRWNDAFGEVLLQQPIPSERLRQLIIEPRALMSEQHRQYNDVRRSIRQDYLWQLYLSLTEQQREVLVEKADEYEQLLSDLIEYFNELQ
ncbi:DUF6279 family lipoprotein [Idiomarina seosinensis]|uniref:DUF6279 family lipoprotein n=1 Tax=Idiomarina seosinensis TaxID=281739 RepID=UPI00384F4C53